MAKQKIVSKSASRRKAGVAKPVRRAAKPARKAARPARKAVKPIVRKAAPKAKPVKKAAKIKAATVVKVKRPGTKKPKAPASPAAPVLAAVTEVVSTTASAVIDVATTPEPTAIAQQVDAVAQVAPAPDAGSGVSDQGTST